jgi:surface polysaccharide O-acyltransferase-like enzyme
MPSKNFTYGRCQPGEIAVPLFLMASGVVLLMNNFDMVRLRQVWDLWPLLLAAAGVENLAAQVRRGR